MKPVNVLLVEDSETDAALVLRELQRGGYEPSVERVETASAMAEALERRSWDIVISDYSLPQFSAPLAYEVLARSGLDIPFIIVSGTKGEETAVESMKAGAHDFILKDQLSRLVPALTRELSEAQGRRERRRVEDQLLLSDRMASIGMLAAGVAHEINNPLAAIVGNLGFVVEEFAALQRNCATCDAVDVQRCRECIRSRFDATNEALRDAVGAAQRVRSIVGDMKVFSRPQQELSGPVDVRQVMDACLGMASNEIRHRARLTKHYGDVRAVLGHEARIGQVFLNLLINAAQSIEEGHMDQNEIRVIVSAGSPDRVIIEVRDTGCGIPADRLARIFDPFYTTKRVGEGTGLGLSICQRLVTDLRGTIEVQSDPRGSTFRVELPATNQLVPPPRPISIAPPKLARRGRLLAIDDDPFVLRMLDRVLRGLHDVVTVASAAGALRLLDAGEHFDVILCDLMMPEITGMDLHATLMTRAPEMATRMVFLTGGAFTPGAQAFLETNRNERLTKPVDLRELRAVTAKYC